MHTRKEKWNNFRDKAGGRAGIFYTWGTVGLIGKSFIENWNDMKGMVGSDSILDTLAMPVMLTSARIMRRHGNTHAGKAAAFYISAVGKGMIMTRLAFDGDWKSFTTLGLDTAFTVGTATQSLVKHIRGKKIANDNHIPPPAARSDEKKKNTLAQFHDNVKDITGNYPNAIPLGAMFAIKTMTIAAMISEGQYIYAGINVLWNIGTALTGLSRQKNKKEDSAIIK